MQTGVLHHRHHFGVLQDADQSRTVVPGDPASGVLPRISAAPPGEYGAGRPADPGLLLPHVPDRSSRQPHPVSEAGGLRSQASTSCCCASSRPAGARPSRSSTRFPTARPTPTITARSAPTTSAMNYDYPEASYERRREILQEHERYQKGWLYFIANDPRGAGRRARRDARVGPGEGRVHGQRRLAAPDLRARSAADDRARS